MSNWRQIPLQNKVTLATFAIAAGTVAVAFAAMVAIQLFTLRTDFEEEFQTLARIAAENSVHAVRTGDAEAAENVLRSLRQMRNFRDAWIETADNYVFVTLGPRASDETIAAERAIRTSAPITADGRIIGMIWVEGDYRAERDRRLTFLVELATAVVVICVIGGSILARRAHRVLLRPVLELARAAERVARERDLSLRVNRTSDDEVGLLTTRFNDMLSQIEAQERQIEKARRELESKVVALEFEIAERRRIESALAEVKEHEERRLANDLHDGLGQLLTGIAFKAHLLSSLLEEKDPANSRLAAGLVELANESVRQARNIAHGVAPVDAAGLGLASALVHLGEQVERLMGCSCTVRVPEVWQGMPLHTSVELYRICQEAVHNAARHGRATEIEIVLEERNSVWCLDIGDNGSGLPPKSERREGLGLKLMAHRAHSVGGTIAFVRNSRGGLTVRCAVPVSAGGPVVPVGSNIEGHN